MRFFFPWETILNWKRNLEEASQMRLAAKAGELKAQEEEIGRLRDRRLAHTQTLSEKSEKGMYAEEYAQYKQFAEDLHRDLLRREETKKEIIRELESERENLIRLTKEKKILEKLKEKKWKEFVDRSGHLEQKENDEIVVMKYRPPQH